MEIDEFKSPIIIIVSGGSPTSPTSKKIFVFRVLEISNNLPLRMYDYLSSLRVYCTDNLRLEPPLVFIFSDG